jgi:hypothetical protein
MFTRITNLEGILHTPTCCECKQEISLTVNLRLGSRIPILKIRIHTGGLICVTDSQCMLVYYDSVNIVSFFFLEVVWCRHPSVMCFTV